MSSVSFLSVQDMQVSCSKLPTSASGHHDKAVPAGHGGIDGLALVQPEGAIAKELPVAAIDLSRPGELVVPLAISGAIRLSALHKLIADSRR